VDGSHIRTLLLTFFYRHIPQLIEGGYLYIAQPPLYKISKGKSSEYLKDERTFERYLIRKISQEFQIKVSRRKEIIKGDKFRRFLQKIIAKKNYIRILERKSYPLFLIDILLSRGVEGSGFLEKKKNMETIQSLLTEKGIVSVLSSDEEHGLYELAVNFQINGMNVSCKVNLGLIQSVEYQNLYKIHKDLLRFNPPFQLISNSDKIKIENEAKLLEYLFDKGKKGIVIQRYKGLGEMTPEQLWETTLDPEKRFLTQVSIRDAVEADKVFTILMGNEVEPRRDFLEENALEAQNLDI
jgi:DNA gyrase subunit B